MDGFTNESPILFFFIDLISKLKEIDIIETEKAREGIDNYSNTLVLWAWDETHQERILTKNSDHLLRTGTEGPP